MTNVNKLVGRWSRRLFLKRISTAVIVVLLLLSVSVIGLSIYGNNVGNFVIAIEQDTRLSLSLSENGDFENNATALLDAKGLENATNCTYANIPNNINDFFGQHSDVVGRRYMAYSFFLKNTSPIAVAYTMEIVVNQSYKNVISAVRVMVYTDGTPVIYAQANADGTPTIHNTVEEKHYTTTPFIDDATVCRVFTSTMDTEAVVKYTVVMWLEGYDTDCTNDIKGGAIRMSMNFSCT